MYIPAQIETEAEVMSRGTIGCWRKVEIIEQSIILRQAHLPCDVQ